MAKQQCEVSGGKFEVLSVSRFSFDAKCIRPSEVSTIEAKLDGDQVTLHEKF
jgi:hypothetical protein